MCRLPQPHLRLPLWLTPGFFSLEAAQQQMGLVEMIETTLAPTCAAAQAAGAAAGLRVLTSEPETRWHKLAHLLYLPVLAEGTRPADPYYLDNVTFARHCEERRLRRSNLVLWAGDCFASHRKNHAVLRSQ